MIIIKCVYIFFQIHIRRSNKHIKCFSKHTILVYDTYCIYSFIEASDKVSKSCIYDIGIPSCFKNCCKIVCRTTHLNHEMYSFIFDLYNNIITQKALNYFCI